MSAARLNAKQREVVREKLLSTAAQHFAERGLAGANINAISIDAGFARGTIYNYFESKTALFAAVVREGADLAVAHYRGTPGLSTMSTADKLLVLLSADVELVRKNEPFARAFVAEAFSPLPEVKAAVDTAIAPFALALGEIVHQGQTAGELTTGLDIRQLVMVTMGVVTVMYAAQWRGPKPLFPWDELARQMQTVVLSGLGPLGR